MTSHLTKAAWFLAGVVVAVAFSSVGVEAQAEVGHCKMGTAKNGMFYQDDRPTVNDLETGCYSLGIASQFENSLWGWKVAYHSLGTINSGPSEATIWDEDAFRALDQPCDSVTKRNCTMTIYGRGRAYGFSFSLTRKFPFETFDLMTEGGLLFFRHRYHAWAQRHDDGVWVQAWESSSLKNPPDFLFGVGLKKGPVYMTYRRAWSFEHRESSLTDHSFQQIMLGVSIPLN